MGFHHSDRYGRNIEAALKAAAETYKANLEASDNDLDPAAVEQIDGAIVAAVAAVPVVAPGQLVQITLSGHANPDHVPHPAWANDMVSMYVSNAAPKPEAPAAA